MPAALTPGGPRAPGSDTRSGQPKPGPPRLEKVGTFDRPIYLTSPPGDRRIFVAEQKGRIVEMVGGRARTPAYLDISADVLAGGERGFFSMAFAPDYARSGLVYVSYTNRDGNSRIEEFRVDRSNPNRLDPASRRLILGVDQPFANHNGGLIAFDPTGMLMIGLGDGGSAGDPGNRAQNLNVLLGKLLRIDPRKPSGGRPYGIPGDNPFVGRPGARPEVWAYGLRNPWRWSFDAGTGDLYVADVGERSWEEISFAPPAVQSGANYGWRRYEGNKVFKDEPIDESRLVMPVLTYALTGGNCAVTGGGVYRGSVLALKGFYLYGDYCAGVIKGFKVTGGKATDSRTFGDLNVPQLASFGQDSEGEMYALSLGGSVYRITG